MRVQGSIVRGSIVWRLVSVALVGPAILTSNNNNENGIVSVSVGLVDGFVIPQQQLLQQHRVVVSRVKGQELAAATSSEPVPSTTTTTTTTTATTTTTTTPQSNTESTIAPSGTKKQTSLGLITFDLDDTLYPIAPVIDEANKAFAAAMERYGFPGISPNDINLLGKQIRTEMEPEEAATLTHTEIRQLAIRRKMEQIVLERKLQETADDWATPVSALADVVVSYAKKWARTAVSPSIVDAVLTAWEMERHHAAERHLYPEVIEFFRQLKQKYPNVVVGAVTDGKANPCLMTFTLGPYFDYCISWEDDQGGRSKFFTDLSKVEGNAELSWIYNAAYEKYQEMATIKQDIDKEKPDDDTMQADDKKKDAVWIHVGDDLAYDVGGSSACGAKTIWMELAPKYKQSARLRFDSSADEEATKWSTTTETELDQRRVMNEHARAHVDQRVAYLSQLMEAVDSILSKAEVEQQDNDVVVAEP